MSQAYEKPVPSPTADSQPYWDGLGAHRLMLQSCGACGKRRHYPQPMCDACHSFEVTWIEASRRGTVHSWTETHHPFDASFAAELPITLVTVDLAEGVRLQCRLRDAGLDDLALGLAVEIGFEDVTEELTLPVARLAA